MTFYHVFGLFRFNHFRFLISSNFVFPDRSILLAIHLFEMSVRHYVLGCCCITDGKDDDIRSPRDSYLPFTNESVDHHNKKDSQSIELTTLGCQETGLKSLKGLHVTDTRPGKGDGRTWRDEDLCFKHRRVIYCRRTSLSMTNLFDPLQMEKEEETNQCLSPAQKRCTFPPSRTRNGMKIFAGQNPLENYRRLESDTDSSSRDSISTSSSCETTGQEPEVVLRKKPEQSIDRNCHANKGYVCVKSKIPEAELPRLESNCPLSESKDSKESGVTLNT
ncbi:uncharacterized protein LOC110455022 isoform X2 [Mizuhopecten yessoensis]|uniref:uncharacterized protein LOC110455022 isoform X2 n=1 Tax=Mizuhopecten yessoensis TaxID=6573 RepID=UPI000B45EB89|nr:uncharacterized protein LOC110455022 isoform X2 [Mizuhopecten yessoensis]